MEGGPTYGSADFPVDLGSAGGGDYIGGWFSGTGGSGGGALRLAVRNTLVVDGALTVNGLDAGSGNEAGGGAGGSLWIDARALGGGGLISAAGGLGRSRAGGGGRIALYSVVRDFPGTITVAGGSGEVAAQEGTLVLGSQPVFRWAPTMPSAFHGTRALAWETHAVDTRGLTVTITASRNGMTYTVGTSTEVLLGRLDWDTSTVPDGVHELRAIFRDATGRVVADLRHDALVANTAAVVWHSGTLAADEVWTPGAMHVVDRDLRVQPGVTLTLEPGTVVKVLDGVTLTIADTATLAAPGAPGLPIILTSIQDDTAGGDTNRDGPQTRPVPGSWTWRVEGTGQVRVNADTLRRYYLQAHAGTLAGDETWAGTLLHLVAQDVSIPAGSTLTIQPGAVVKFASRRGLTVASGGALNASGTVAQPIVFTSDRDDSAGGDTNGDGAGSLPAAGDWRGIFADGGDVWLDHVELSYGAGTSSGDYEWGAGTLRTGPGSRLRLLNSVLRDSAFEGIHATTGGDIALTNTPRCVSPGAPRAGGAGAFAPTCVATCSRAVMRPTTSRWPRLPWNCKSPPCRSVSRSATGSWKPALPGGTRWSNPPGRNSHCSFRRRPPRVVAASTSVTTRCPRSSTLTCAAVPARRPWSGWPCRPRFLRGSSSCASCLRRSTTAC